MRRTHFLIIAFVSMLLISWSLYDFFRPVEEKLHWIPDYESALNKAETENKTIMVFIYTEWCSWCKKMNADTFSNDEVASFLNLNFICIRIDFEKNSDLVAMYDIPGFPTVLLLSAEGEELGRMMGYKPPDIFMIEASPYVSTS